MHLQRSKHGGSDDRDNGESDERENFGYVEVREERGSEADQPDADAAAEKEERLLDGDELNTLQLVGPTGSRKDAICHSEAIAFE